MRKLEATLVRMGASELSAILNRSTIRLLEVLDLRNLSPTRLADLLILQLRPEGILLHTDIRRKLIDALHKDDAERLARLLDLPPSSNPWSTIKALNFNRGQRQTDVLFAFFGCPSPFEGQDNYSSTSSVLHAQYPLFEYQRRAYNTAFSYLTSGTPRRVLLHMPTGAGKTRTAMHIVSQFLRSLALNEIIVWLAHTEELCEQAAEEFEKAWVAIGNREITLFRHFGPYRIDLDQVQGGLLVGGLKLLYQHSLSHQSAFLRLAGRTSLVVMDEAHQAVAPTYHHLLNLLALDSKTAILGLSATPGRSWLNAIEDLKLAMFFGRQKVTLQVEGSSNPIEFLQREGYLAEVEYISLPYISAEPLTLTEQETEDLRVGFDLSERVISTLEQDHQRNLLILMRIMQEADNGGKILVFACSMEHAITLANLLRMKGYSAASITSATRPEHRRQFIAKYRDTGEIQILTNYGVLTTGFDAPNTNVAVIVRPTRSVVLYGQMVGRAARGPKAGGNVTCRILTVVDQIPGFRGISEAFGHWEDIWEDIHNS